MVHKESVDAPLRRSRAGAFVMRLLGSTWDVPIWT